MKIRKLMYRDVVTAHKNQSLQLAAKLLIENKIRHLPVLCEGKKLAGVITDRDLKGGLGLRCHFARGA